MMKKSFKSLALCLALLLSGAASAQTQTPVVEEEFNPHFYVLPQVGLGHHRGEAKLGDLISPAAALSVGYQFSPVLGLRLGASGWESRNWQTHPSAEYKWNYLQANLDLTVSLLNLFCGQKPLRKFDVYAFIGGGANYAFNNDDAKELYAAGGNFEKIWCGHRWSPVVRGGLGLDYSLSPRVVLGLEANTNVLSDHFNSKRGLDDNRDWQSHLLLGVKIALGKTTRQKPVKECCKMEQVSTEPVAPMASPEPQPEPVQVQQPQKEVEVRQPLRVEVFFQLAKTDIQPSEETKLQALADYLKQYPQDLVNVSGYADAATGNHSINQTLSEGRSEQVKQWLVAHGVSASRISTQAQGDLVQPHDTPASNRVVICLTETK